MRLFTLNAGQRERKLHFAGDDHGIRTNQGVDLLYFVGSAANQLGEPDPTGRFRMCFRW